MVARNHHLVLVREGAEVPVELLQRGEAAVRAKGDVARVAEDITRRQIDVSNLAVRIRDEDDTNCSGRLRRQ